MSFENGVGDACLLRMGWGVCVHSEWGGGCVCVEKGVGECVCIDSKMGWGMCVC